MDEIKGFKGGGGKGRGGGGSSRAPIESPDSLRSRAYARVLDLLCEGEIEGLVDGLKSVYLDETPIQNDDDTFNFTGVTLDTRNGTQNQSYIVGFPSVESESAVNVQVIASGPVTRTITGAQFSAVRVTLAFPQLSDVNTANGDTRGTSVEIAIDVQPDGGSFTQVRSDTITGKTTTKYQKSYYIPLAGAGPWTVRVRRITPDSARATLQNQSWWESYTAIVESKLRYTNSALVASIIDSQQFGRIPNRGYDTKLLRIRIPSNATARDDGSLTYTGTWDGLFQIAWSSNPAWVFYDIVTSGRYGLGDFIPEAQIDKWALYEIGRYCDELVSDGFGGLEPRFSANLYFQEQAEAFKVMQDMASIFRGMAFWSAGQITAVQDAPSDPVALFTNANVKEGLFTYQGSSLKNRPTVVLVNWNDPDDYYRQKPEYVEDQDGIARFGIVKREVAATGCTSRGQAHRVGKWLLYSEANETETVSFNVGIDGCVARPGQIINVADKDRAGARRGGRIRAATVNQITMDSAFTAAPATAYTISVMMPDGSVESRAVSSFVGDKANLLTALPLAPRPDAVFMIASDDLQPQTFRVITVIESGQGEFEITALKHNPEKFDVVENDLILDPVPISKLTSPPDAPSGVTITEALYQSSAEVRTRVSIAWNGVEAADSYAVTYQVNSNNPVTVTGIRSQIYEIDDALPGTYNVSVVAVSIIGKRSQPGVASKVILGKTAPPTNVTGFSLAGISNGVAQLVWDQAPDLDVIVGGYVRIRYSPAVVGATWFDAVDIGPALPGSATTASVPHVNGTYLAKFVDSSGNPSFDASPVITTAASVIGLNVIETIDESAFPGTMVGVFYSATLGGLTLGTDLNLDDVPDFIDDWTEIDTLGGIAAAGEYAFQNTYDLGGVYTSLLTASIAAQAYAPTELVDSRAALIDTWTEIDGSVDIDDVNAVLYVRTTEDDPGGTPVWSSWRPFFVGQYSARGFQFKLLLTSENPDHSIVVTDLVVRIDMPDRVESGSNIASGASSYVVSFGTPFKETPAIGISPRNMATGDYFALTGPSATGFTIQFYNAGGTAINRTFDYIAKGYGGT